MLTDAASCCLSLLPVLLCCCLCYHHRRRRNTAAAETLPTRWPVPLMTLLVFLTCVTGAAVLAETVEAGVMMVATLASIVLMTLLVMATRQ